MDHRTLRAGLKEKLMRVNQRMTESEAGDEARRLGLFSKGFGRWSEKEGGPTTHMNKDGVLVPYVAKAKKGKPAPKAGQNQAPEQPGVPEKNPKAMPATQPSDTDNTMMKKGPAKSRKFDADTTDIGGKVPNPTKAAVKKTTGADGSVQISHKDAKTHLAGMIKKLTQDNPNSRISIEPTESGFTLKAVPVQQGEPKKTTVDVGPLSINPIDGSISINGAPLKVTPTESKLLTYLAGNQDKVIARGQLLEKVWGAQPDIATRTVDMTIARLKQKMGEAGSMLQNVRGMGYRINSDNTPAPAYSPEAPSNDGYEENPFDTTKRTDRIEKFLGDRKQQAAMYRRLRGKGMSDDEIQAHPIFQLIAQKDAEHQAKYAAPDAEREKERTKYDPDDDWRNNDREYDDLDYGM